MQIQFLGIKFEEGEFPIYDLHPEFSYRFNSKKERYDFDNDCNKDQYLFQKLYNSYELNEQSCKIYFTNSSRLAPVIPLVKRLQYRLVDLNRDKRYFFRKFVSIHEILVNHELADPAFFLKFIQDQTRLQALKFNNSKLSQSNFDALDRFLPRLTELCIQHEPITLCFDFTLKLSNLVVLKTDQSIRFEIVQQLSAKIPVSVIFYNYNSNQIQITCDAKDMCSLFFHWMDSLSWCTMSSVLREC